MNKKRRRSPPSARGRPPTAHKSRRIAPGLPSAADSDDNAKQEPTLSLLCDMAVEVMEHVALSAPAPTVARLRGTCRHLAAVCGSDRVWKSLAVRDFGDDAVQSGLCVHASRDFGVAWRHVYRMLDDDGDDGTDRVARAGGWGRRHSGSRSVRAGRFDDKGTFEGFGAHFFLDPLNSIKEVYATHEAGRPTRGIRRKRDGHTYEGDLNSDFEPHGRGSLTYQGVRLEGVWANGELDLSQASTHTHLSGPRVAIEPGGPPNIDFFTDHCQVKWPADHALFRSYDGEWKQGSRDRSVALWHTALHGKPDGYGVLVLATGEVVSAYFCDDTCAGLVVANDPATGLTRFLFPPTNLGANRPEVRVDRRGSIYVVDAAGRMMTAAGHGLCAIISSFSISPERGEQRYTAMGSLITSYGGHVDEFDLLMQMVTPMPERLARHMPTRPVGSIMRSGHEEMVFYFAYDLVHACASLKREGLYDFTVRVTPSPDGLAQEARRARALRWAGTKDAPVPLADDLAYLPAPADYADDAGRLYREAVAWRVAMSQHMAPETARTVLGRNLFGPTSAGSPTFMDAEVWTSYVARTNDGGHQRALSSPQANPAFDYPDDVD